MNATVISKEQWVEVLEAAGVNEEGRRRWHQAFLQWLQLPAGEIGSIREWSKG